jgi:hypothetical protein
MKTIARRLAAAFLAAFCCLLSSCAVAPGYGGGGGYNEPYYQGNSGSRGYGQAGYDEGYYPAARPSYSQSNYYRPTTTRYLGTGVTYGSGYGYGRTLCSHCHHSPCTCASTRYRNGNDHHDDHSGHNHRSSRKEEEEKAERIRLLSKSKDKPDGYHKKEWFQKRGISLKNHSYETESGRRVKR